MIPSFDIIIPARFASQRLPGKPLRDICGKPLIQRVYECACDSSAESVTVATDDPGILRVAESFGANVCLTSVEHLQKPMGTLPQALLLNISHLCACSLIW